MIPRSCTSPPRASWSRVWRASKAQARRTLLVTPDDFAFFALADNDVDPDMTVEEALMESASPIRSKRRSLDAEQQNSFIQRMGPFCMDTPEIVDRFTFGIANRFKDIESQRERFERIREEIYVAVQLHEVGHTVGLYHNFEASTDSLNYGERFWDLQKLPTDINEAINGSADAGQIAQLQSCLTEQDRIRTQFNADVTFTTQECLRQPEAMYASIMDYHGQWNGDFNGLGPYDEAAHRLRVRQTVAGVRQRRARCRPAHNRHPRLELLQRLAQHPRRNRHRRRRG